MTSTGVKFTIRELFGYADCNSLEIITPNAKTILFQTSYFNVNEAAGVLVIQNEIKTSFIDLQSIQRIQCNTDGCKHKISDRNAKAPTFRNSIINEKDK